MDVRKLFLENRSGLFADVALVVLTVVSFVAYLVYAAGAEGLMFWPVPVLLSGVLVSAAVQILLRDDWSPVAAAACAAGALGCFLAFPPETLGSVADYYQNIVMFGNPDKFDEIVVNVVLMFSVTAVAVLSCFLRRRETARG